MSATFECQGCGQEFEDELPALDHVEAWPVCCGEDAYLIRPFEDDEASPLA